MVGLLSVAFTGLSIAVILLGTKINTLFRQDVSLIDQQLTLQKILKIHDGMMVTLNENLKVQSNRINELETQAVKMHLNIAGLREFVQQNIKPKEAIEKAVKKIKTKQKEKPNDAGNIQSN